MSRSVLTKGVLLCTLLILVATSWQAKAKPCDGGDGSVKNCCNARGGFCGGCKPGFGIFDIQGTAFSSIGTSCQRCSGNTCYTCFFDKRRNNQESCSNYGEDEIPEQCEEGSPRDCSQCRDGFTVYTTNNKGDICAKDLTDGVNCPIHCTKCNSKVTKCTKCDFGYTLKKNGKCKKKN